MRPIITYNAYNANKKEIDAYHQARKEWEPVMGRPDEFLPLSNPTISPRKSAVKAKWQPTPTEENRRPDEWLASEGSSGVPPKKRSWKSKEEIPKINF
jgi:hypothetical protein